MGNVICNNQQCKFRGQNGGFCNLDFTYLNAFGQCRIWFNKNGAPYPGPMYPFDLPQDAEKEQKV